MKKRLILAMAALAAALAALFVNRLLRGGKHIVITGSNSRLLTDDLAKHLTVDIVTWLLEAPKEQGQAPLGIKCQSVS